MVWRGFASLKVWVVLCLGAVAGLVCCVCDADGSVWGVLGALHSERVGGQGLLSTAVWGFGAGGGTAGGCLVR